MNHLTPTRVLKPLISYFLAKSFKNHLTPTRVLKLIVMILFFTDFLEPPHTHTGIETSFDVPNAKTIHEEPPHTLTGIETNFRMYGFINFENHLTPSRVLKLILEYTYRSKIIMYEPPHTHTVLKLRLPVRNIYTKRSTSHPHGY